MENNSAPQRLDRAERAKRREEKRAAEAKKRTLRFFKLGCSGIFLIVFIVIVIFALRTYSLFLHARDGLLNTDEIKGKDEIVAEIVIPEGSTLRDISLLLYDEGIIESPFFFRWKCNVEDYAYSFNYGTFTVSSYMSFIELAECLSGAGDDEGYFKLTVIEGESVFDIAEKLEEAGICSQDEFYEVCETGDFDYEFINEIPDRENRLEGYLFPDTYFVEYDMTPWQVVNMMLSNFNTKVYEGVYTNAVKGEYSLDDIVIIASIIEKEIKYDEERSIAASVIYNRLNIGMKLQMDATVLYASGENKSRVWEADTEIESEYNTYYVDGLPIGPIGNAGLSSFEGALNPADTDYIYYVLENSETGQHYFTADYDDFLRAKEQYISGL
ncbi:MAG: endolytic transglycosylase MltG [Clostridiales bacterium]|nr:endolytic transglycosylase MltG [Clostridiales bacterium]